MNKNQNIKKQKNGLLLAIAIVVGTVIGTGIFFKNESMIPWAQGKGWLVISTWLFGSIIALSTALAFSQIAKKALRTSNSGIGEFAQEMIGDKFGWHTKINWALFYFPWNGTIISLYAANYFVKIALPDSHPENHTMLIIGVATIMGGGLFALNIFSKKISEWVQINATFIKMIPIIIMSIGAIITFFILHDSNWWNSAHNPALPDKSKETAGQSLPFLIFFLVPGALFAFDGFINVTNISENVKRKHITYAIIGGMLIIAAAYLLVTIALLNTGTLNVEDAIVKLFGGNPEQKYLTPTYKGIKIIIKLFILISALGTLNGFCFAWTRITEVVLKEKTKKKVAGSMLGAFAATGLPLILVTIIIRYSGMPKGDKIGINLVDAVSNPLIIISYTIYAITLCFSIYRNFRQTNPEQKYAKWFSWTAMISIIGIFSTLGYLLFYSVIYKAIVDPSSVIGGIPRWLFLMIVCFFITYYIFIPFIINKLMKNIYINKEKLSITKECQKNEINKN